MKTLELLAALSERHVQLWIEGDQLRYRAPKGALDAELRDLLSRQKKEVMDLMRRRARESVSLHPLSYAQEGLWFMNQAMPGSTAFNVGFAFRIRSALDTPALKRVIQTLMDRHPMLRTTYSDSNGEAVQYIHGYMQAEFNEVDARAGTKKRCSKGLSKPISNFSIWNRDLCSACFYFTVRKAILSF